ncbi:hypothetical protein AMECASPLE_036253 [Ameca splendens]|uniref:Uncharacterized protein n=1 Tax=Ameca splendens TaxID=208324 RepID=A0ABV0XKM2_9TELE
MNLLTFLYQQISSFQALPGMAVWSKSSPACFCLSRYAPPMRHPVTHAGNGNKSLFSTGFIIPGDVRAATSVELLMFNCAAQPVYLIKMDDPNMALLFTYIFFPYS